jgi:gamma-glutamyltranspeptidase / glutathione hydrolase
MRLVRRLFLVALSAAALAVVLSSPLGGQSAHVSDARDPRLNQGPKTVASGERVMVSTQLPDVTEAAVDVLRRGGNAVDAFITAVFLQHVVDYHQVSHFGAMAGLYYEAATGRYYAFDAYSERPDADTCGTGDASKVAIGGTVRGLEALAQRFGTRPWASYVDPAIRAAEEGVVVTSFMYGANYADWDTGDLIKGNAEARDFFMPNGHLVPVGARWKMPTLAGTLRGVASEGADYLYTGAWGKKFVEQARKKGFCVSEANMAAYEVRWAEPVRTTYRGYEIIGEPAPKKGGIQIAYALNILEQFDLKALGHYTESAEALDTMARALGRVEDDIRHAVVDPLAFRVPTEVFLSKDYARFGADIVRQSQVQPNVRLVAPATASVEAGVFRVERFVDGQPVADDSNHNVIVDADGNWISSLHTMHGGAPGLFIDGVRAIGSGFAGQVRGPGRRVSANSTGVFVARDGKPWLSIGSPGVPPQPVTQVLANIIDFGMSPKEAAEAPRFFAFRTNERVIDIESRLPDALRREAAARGLKLKDAGPFNWHMGSMQIVWRDAQTGTLHGVSDPRRLGYAAGY